MSENRATSTSTPGADQSVTVPPNDIRRSVLAIVVAVVVVGLAVLVVRRVLRDDAEDRKKPPSRAALLCEALDHEFEVAHRLIEEAREALVTQGEEAEGDPPSADACEWPCLKIREVRLWRKMDKAYVYYRAARIVGSEAGAADFIDSEDDSKEYYRARRVIRSKRWRRYDAQLDTAPDELRRALRKMNSMIDEAQGICREAFDYWPPRRGASVVDVSDEEP